MPFVVLWMGSVPHSLGCLADQLSSQLMDVREV